MSKNHSNPATPATATPAAPAPAETAAPSPMEQAAQSLAAEIRKAAKAKAAPLADAAAKAAAAAGAKTGRDGTAPNQALADALREIANGADGARHGAGKARAAATETAATAATAAAVDSARRAGRNARKDFRAADGFGETLRRAAEAIYSARAKGGWTTSGAAACGKAADKLAARAEEITAEGERTARAVLAAVPAE